jgi:TonB family protein
MKFPLIAVFVVIVLSVPGFAQSGRKAKVVQTPPPVQEPTSNPPPKPVEPPLITAEKNEEYRCTEDGTLARIIEPEVETEPILTAKNVDVRANILSRPRPSYTREARRAGVQGYVLLRAVLLANGEIGTIRVVRGLPAGLTANAIRAACKIQFKPAMKDGKAVSQLVQVEYAFRLAESSILGP